MKINSIIIIFLSILICLIPGCSNEDDIIGKDIIDSELYDVTLYLFQMIIIIYYLTLSKKIVFQLEEIIVY